MKKIRILKACMIVACCIGVLCAKELKASAEITFHSRGNFVTDDGKVAFYKTDLDYLGSEIAMLEDEIDPSIMEQTYSNLRNVSHQEHQETVRSKGIIDYDNGKMVLDSQDVMDLAAGLDLLEKQYAVSAGLSLDRIGTFIDASGNVSHTKSSDEAVSMPTLEQIRKGICQSQSVDHLVDVSPFIADNLTAGTAAWVNGRCIIGNGADNERAYKRGQEDGEDEKDVVDVDYIYHTHINGRGEEVTEETVYTLTDPGGCYKEDGHVHDKIEKCPSEKKTVPITHVHEVKNNGNPNDAWCPHCGHITHFGEGDTWQTHDCTYDVEQTVYKCGSPTNRWSILCGKQNGQIEGCVIHIRTKK